MSKLSQDQFIDDDEEPTCPLCVEEFDLTDKGFRPCECGYQICQFCYNNVKNNMNGLCPACRRPYDDAKIVTKVPSPEEIAAHKTRQAQKAKKSQAAAQKEKAKAEADNMSRKHLAGLRVVQKNLVYVTGLTTPTMQEDQLLQTLRGDQYFGQYGKIIKIVVSKAKDNAGPHSVGIYVTYERKEDAQQCINLVNGLKNNDRTLRAQYGTTKYCSSFLRGETCLNRNCMFLHEPGEENESYTRAALSAHNAGSSQQGHGGAPPPQSQQPIASAAPPQASDDQPPSPTTDRPALPSHASWASKPMHLHRSESRAASSTVESPAMSSAVMVSPPAEASSEAEAKEAVSGQLQNVQSSSAQDPNRLAPISRQQSLWARLIKDLRPEDLSFQFSLEVLSEPEQAQVLSYPPLFDENGGPRRRLRRQREEEQRRMAQEAQAFEQPPAVEADDDPEMSGSLQLGGEPEERSNHGQMQSAIHRPGQDESLDQRYQFGGISPGVSDRGILSGLKPTAQDHYAEASQSSSFPSSLQQQTGASGHQRNGSRYNFANDSGSASTTVKPVANPKLMSQQISMMPPPGVNNFNVQQPHGQFITNNVSGPPPGLKNNGTPPVSGNSTFGQGHGFATGGLQYGQGASRNQQDQYYRELMRGRDGTTGGVDAKREFNTFPNYNSTHPGAVYPAGQSNAYTASSYPSLTAFGDGEKQRKKKGKNRRHANTSSSGGGVVDVATDPTNHLLHSRLHQGTGGLGGSAFAGQAGAADETDFPPLRPPTRTQSTVAHLDESRRSTPPVPPGFESQVAHESRRSTPAAPPGFPARPTALPDLEGSIASRPSSRPSSRTSLRRAVSSQITPALPLRPTTPGRPATPSRLDDSRSGLLDETPTKPSRAAATSDLRLAISARDISPEAGVENVSLQAANEDGTGITPARNDAKETAAESMTVQSGTEPVIATTVQSTNPDLVKNGEENDAAPMTPIKAEVGKRESSKRKHPGKLDITAAVMEQAQSTEAASIPFDNGTPRGIQRSAQAVATPSSSKAPDSPAPSSPGVKPTLRTLRILPTPKIEAAPAVPTQAPSLPTKLANRMPSRQPSVTSINLPGTPSSEQPSMSDNVSLPSTSLSRANSPPPASNKVGTAPVRAKTKSQAKKERLERSKKALAEEVFAKQEEEKAHVEAPAQEAIVSRKKKAKKENQPKLPRTKAVATTTASTPTVSQPASPGAKVEVKGVQDDAPQVEVEEKKKKPTTPVKTPPVSQQCVSSPPEPSPPPTPTSLTSADILASIKAATPEIQKCIDNLFRVTNNSHFRPPPGLSAKDMVSTDNWKAEMKVNLTKQEVDDLRAGKLSAVHYGDNSGVAWDHGMITSTGAHLRALNKEVEDRYLELEKLMADLPTEFKFRHSKPENEYKFPTVDLGALKRQFEAASSRGISVMEQMVQESANMRKGAYMVDDASRYINEFVMPPPTPPPNDKLSHSGKDINAGPGGFAHPAAQHQQAKEDAERRYRALQIPAGLEAIEKQLNAAKRFAEEREMILKRQIKKNKKMMGYSA